jgi:tetratricopeptide (TPR) repeat protein
MLKRAAPFVVAVALAAGALVARSGLEQEARRVGEVRDPTWLPSGKLLRLVSMGQRLTLADFYWLKAVQYTGAMVMANAKSWEALYPLADLVTDLDPRYGYAYQVVASNLSGLAAKVAESDRLLEKGMRHLPDRYSLPFLYAFNKFFYENDFAEAARYARRAAEVGKRPHLALLAANLSLVADTDGEYAVAASFLEDAIRQASQGETPELREQLEQRLVRVRTYQVLSQVEKAVAAYEQRAGRRPFSLLELVGDGLLPGLPRDPAGGEILFDYATGTVKSSVLGERKPIRPE